MQKRTYLHPVSLTVFLQFMQKVSLGPVYQVKDTFIRLSGQKDTFDPLLGPKDTFSPSADEKDIYSVLCHVRTTLSVLY